ncbi:MAG: MerR family transcriptional regulator [Desulfobacterales bacterium]|jgi:DNA-binding transcriptional MerR regulator
MENAKKHFAISELAKEFDVSKRHIRFCEEKGLISPRITTLNRRIYSRYDRARLRLIFHCVLIGYSQDQIVELIGIPDTGLNEMDQIKKGLAYAEGMIEKLDKRRNELSFHQRTSIINEIKLLREYVKEIKAITLGTSDESPAKPLIPDKKRKDKARKPVEKIKPEVERIPGRKPVRMMPIFIAGLAIVLIIGSVFYLKAGPKKTETRYLVKKDPTEKQTQPVYHDRIPIDNTGDTKSLTPIPPESPASTLLSQQELTEESKEPFSRKLPKDQAESTVLSDKLAPEPTSKISPVSDKISPAPVKQELVSLPEKQPLEAKEEKKILPKTPIVEKPAAEKAAAERATAEKAAVERAAAEKAAAEKAAAEKAAAEKAAAEKAAAEKAAAEKAAAEKAAAEKAAVERAAAEKAAAERAAAERAAAEKAAAEKAAAEKAAAEEAATEKAAAERAAAEKAAAEKAAAEKAAAEEAAAEKAAAERAAAEKAAAEKAAAEKAAAEEAAAEKAAAERAAAEKAAADKAAAEKITSEKAVKSSAVEPEVEKQEVALSEVKKDVHATPVTTFPPVLPQTLPAPEKHETVSRSNSQASEVEVKESTAIQESEIKKPSITPETDQSVTQERKAERPGVVEESKPSEPEKDKKMLASKEKMLSQQDQKDRLESFLRIYCRAYESKDLDKFASLFTPDATENNTPFQDMLPNYRKNMENIESFNYRIELVDYFLQNDTGNIRMKGKYFTRFLLHEETWEENSGSIFMELIISGDSYLIKRLNYGK